MKDFRNGEPVVTIPAALAVLVNSLLAVLAKAGVFTGDLVPELTAVINGCVVVIGLLLARRQVTPTFKAEEKVENAITAGRAAATAAREQVRPRPKRTRS